MTEEKQITTLEDALEQIGAAAGERERVSVEVMLKALGTRSFGPLLLLAGLITLAPLVGDIPGVPTVIGIFVILVSVQLMLQRRHIWLPKWMMKRSISSQKVHKAIKWSRRPAKLADRVAQNRLHVFVEGPAYYVLVAVSMAVAAAMPLMEFVPFSANIAGAALTAMGLALIARDGLLSLVAISIVAVAGFFIVRAFL